MSAPFWVSATRAVHSPSRAQVLLELEKDARRKQLPAHHSQSGSASCVTLGSFCSNETISDPIALLPERDSVDEFHREERLPVLFSDVENGHDVGMIGQAGFLMKSAKFYGGRGAATGKHLQGDEAIEFLVTGTKHDAHSVASERIGKIRQVAASKIGGLPPRCPRWGVGGVRRA